MTDVPVVNDGAFKTATVPGGKGELEISLRSDGNNVKFVDKRAGSTRFEVWQERVTFHDFNERKNYEINNSQVAQAVKGVIASAFKDGTLTDDEQRQIENFKNMIIGDIVDGKFDNVTSIVNAAKAFVPSKG